MIARLVVWIISLQSISRKPVTGFYPLLATGFTGSNGVPPDSIPSVTLVPGGTEDTAGRPKNIGNYRPIALVSILSKALERTPLTRLEGFVLATDDQF